MDSKIIWYFFSFGSQTVTSNGKNINNLPTSDNTFALKLINVNSKYAA